MTLIVEEMSCLFAYERMLEETAVASGNFGTSEFRNFGISEFRNFGVLTSFRVSEFPILQISSTKPVTRFTELLVEYMHCEIDSASMCSTYETTVGVATTMETE